MNPKRCRDLLYFFEGTASLMGPHSLPLDWNRRPNMLTEQFSSGCRILINPKDFGHFLNDYEVKLPILTPSLANSRDPTDLVGSRVAHA